MLKIKLTLVFVYIFLLKANAQIGFEFHEVTRNANYTEYPIVIRSADLDNDGDQDVVSISVDDGKIVWFENKNGQGSFSAQKLIGLNLNNLSSLFVRDLNGDNYLDIVVTSKDDDKIAWYENLKGSFSEEHVLTTDVGFAYFAHGDDLDGDGDIDILSASIIDDKVVWYENIDGFGNFGPQQTITEQTDGKIGINSADIDGDGDIDVLTSSSSDDKIAWYENIDGFGNFGPQQIITLDANFAIAVYAEDFDGDGDLDVLSCASSGDNLVWYNNTDGLGSFTLGEEFISSANNDLSSAYPSDFDNDGDIDVLAAFGTGDRIQWYENEDGLGNFAFPLTLSTNTDCPKSVYAADLNGDGFMDALSASSADNKLAWYKNNADLYTHFGNLQNIATSYSGRLVRSFDIDMDGDIDMLTVTGSGEIFWYENTDGIGSFGGAQTIAIPPNGSSSRDISLADIDGDGLLDIVTSLFSSNIINWYRNNGKGYFLNLVISSEIESPVSVSTCDFDNDGDIDVLSASDIEDKIMWFENVDGLGNFDKHIIVDQTNEIRSVYAKDFDGDGDKDLLWNNNFIGVTEIIWHENTDGLGNFGPPIIISTDATNVKSLLAEDIDGDGDLDIISGSDNSLNFFGENNVSWYENLDGLGNFGEQQIISSDSFTGLAVKSISISDIDNDGDKDIIAGKASITEWYENTDGLGGFTTHQINNGTGTWDIAANDVDNDGDVDLLLAGDIIEWYENQNLISNKINGFVRLDVNVNGCDVSDVPMANLMIKTSSSTEDLATFTLNNGFFQLFPGEGNFTTTITSMLPEYFSVTPLSLSSEFVGLGLTDEDEFCVEATQNINDVSISLYPVLEARPGFIAKYQLVFRNTGSTQLDGNLSLNFDESKLALLFASEPTSVLSNNNIEFSYSMLAPFETRTIDLEFNVFQPSLVNINDVLEFNTTINPIAGDYNEEDNQFTLNQIVVGSYDPNDITVLEGNEILLEDSDNYLHYIIRFQNTGTASAINVRVDNRLDDNLDWNTLQIENSSHSNRVEIKNGNEVSFIFDDIYLADSTNNEPYSHGFIAYKIKPVSNIELGDIIQNNADIFFDFNSAVNTNTVATEIVELSSIEYLPELTFSIYPIPTSKLLFIESKFTVGKIELYNNLGQIKLLLDNQNRMDISSLAAGLYYCKVTDVHGNNGTQIIVKE